MKVLASKYGYPSSSPETHIVKENNQLPQFTASSLLESLSMDFVVFRTSCVHVHPHMLKSYQHFGLALSHSCENELVEKFKKNSKYCLIYGYFIYFHYI